MVALTPGCQIVDVTLISDTPNDPAYFYFQDFQFIEPTLFDL